MLLDINFVEQILDGIDVYIFAKDKQGRYIFANDNLAYAAGMDSKEQVIGKTDYDLIWRKQAEIFIEGDKKTLAGNPLIKVPEIQDQPDGIKEITTSKNILLSKHNKTLGIFGFYIENTGKKLVDKAGFYDPIKKQMLLGETYGNTYLTECEIKVFYHLLLGYTAKKTARVLNRSFKTIEYHIKNLKHKLQCSSQGELIAIAVSTGLTYTVFDCMKSDINV